MRFLRLNFISLLVICFVMACGGNLDREAAKAGSGSGSDDFENLEKDFNPENLESNQNIKMMGSLNLGSEKKEVFVESGQYHAYTVELRQAANLNFNYQIFSENLEAAIAFYGLANKDGKWSKPLKVLKNTGRSEVYLEQGVKQPGKYLIVLGYQNKKEEAPKSLKTDHMMFKSDPKGPNNKASCKDGEKTQKGNVSYICKGGKWYATGDKGDKKPEQKEPPKEGTCKDSDKRERGDEKYFCKGGKWYGDTKDTNKKKGLSYVIRLNIKGSKNAPSHKGDDHKKDPQCREGQVIEKDGYKTYCKDGKWQRGTTGKDSSQQCRDGEKVIKDNETYVCKGGKWYKL